jgi:hypothetical protein
MGGRAPRTRIASFALLLVLGALPARAQVLPADDKARETPEAFAHRIADLYGPEGAWAKAASPDAAADFDRRVQAEVYDPGFKALLDDNRRLAARWPGADIDHSPLCQCQQVDARVGVESVEPKAPDLAEARMSSCPDPGAGCLAYGLVLKRIAGAWRVYDVIENGDGVRATLEKDNACMAASKSQDELKRCWK